MRFLTQISSIIVALLFIFTINFKSFLTVNYLVNVSEITELFCVNKEKPQLQCNGKCHLASQLIETEKDENNSPFSSSQFAFNLDVISILTHQKSAISIPVKKVNHSYKSNTFNTIDHSYSVPSPPPKV